MNLQDLIDSLALRGAVPSRIQKASAFVGAFELSVSAGLLDEAAWRKELASADTRLVYGESDSVPTNVIKSSMIDSKSIFEFDCVLTSRRKDRDADVVEPKGLRVDPNMPLLWQHLQLQPIGRLLKLLSQDENALRVKFGIADTSLGRDAAVLAEYKALRLSQGFLPTAFAPLEVVKGGDGRDVVKGWHVREADVMEGSLVSIPSNTDGVITAFSRKQLNDPLVQRWAKGFYDARPFMVGGAMSLNEIRSAEAGGEGGAAGGCCGGVNSGPGCGSTSACPPAKKSIQDTCQGDNFPSCGGSRDSDDKCSLCRFKIKANDKIGGGSMGNAQNDQPTPVSEGTAKAAAADLTTKAGKVLSGANKSRLETARTLIGEVLEAATPPADSEDSVDDPNGMKWYAEVAKTTAAFVTKSFSTDLDGSFEWIQDSLYGTARDYFKSQGVTAGDGYVRIAATYPGSAIVVIYPYAQAENKAYRCSWAIVDGVPRWQGTPTEVDVKPQIMDKAATLTKSLAESHAKSAGITIAPPAPAAPKEETISELGRRFVAKAFETGDRESLVSVQHAIEALDAARESQVLAGLLSNPE